MALENQRTELGNAMVDAALVFMHEKLSALIETQQATQQRKLVTVLFMDIVGSTDGVKIQALRSNPSQI
jgi:hypothetical protein